MLSKEPGHVYQQLAIPILKLKLGALLLAEQAAELAARFLVGVTVFKPVQQQLLIQTALVIEPLLHDLAKTLYLWYNF
jgi:hypothetical protein